MRTWFDTTIETTMWMIAIWTVVEAARIIAQINSLT